VKVLLISGFLGSGKTSLLLELVDRLRTDHRRVAIVENEVGEIGIDGRRFTEFGIETREILGGCICCQLNGSLAATLEEIDRTLSVDCVVVETSGLALLQQVLSDLHRRMPDASLRALYLVDVDRLDGSLVDAPPFIVEQVCHADLVLLNKADLADAATLTALSDEARILAPSAPLMRLSLADGSGKDELLEMIASWV